MGKLRRVIFLVFVGIYAIVAPLTVLYALGYILSPSQPALVQTGLISLGTEPSRAAVWVNGTPTKNRTPLILRNLKPGSYDVRAELEGYHPWHRRVEVKPERALRFENILLFPLKPELEILGNFPVKKMGSVPKGKYLVILRGDRASGLFLFNLDEERLEPLPIPPPFRDARVEKFHLHPNGDRALFLLKKDGRDHRLLIHFSETVRIHDVTDILKEPFEDLQWGSGHKSSVFYLQGDGIRRVDLEEGRLYPVLRRRVGGFRLHEGRLYALEASGRFLELTEKGKVRNVLLEDPKKAHLIFGSFVGRRTSIFFLPPSPLFFLSETSLAFFLSDEGKLISNQLPYFLDEGVEKLVLAAAHPRIAYRKANELWMIDFEKEREKTFFESGPTPRKIYEGKGPMDSLSWCYEDQYVLFREGDHLKIQDTEAEGFAIDLLEMSKQTPEFFLDGRRGFLYLIHPDQDRLVRVRFPAEGIRLAPPLLTEFVDDWAAQEKDKK